jgi:hypothetical protein
VVAAQAGEGDPNLQQGVIAVIPAQPQVPATVRMLLVEFVLGNVVAWFNPFRIAGGFIKGGEGDDRPAAVAGAVSTNIIGRDAPAGIDHAQQAIANAFGNLKRVGVAGQEVIFQQSFRPYI